MIEFARIAFFFPGLLLDIRHRFASRFADSLGERSDGFEAFIEDLAYSIAEWRKKAWYSASVERTFMG